jgi:hypothetical protein
MSAIRAIAQDLIILRFWNGDSQILNPSGNYATIPLATRPDAHKDGAAHALIIAEEIS